MVVNLTDQQKRALEHGEAVTVTIDQTEFVMVRRDLYDCAGPICEYDDSDWTEAERRALAVRTFNDADTAEPIE